MYERFIDRIDRTALIKSSPDFKLRRHGLPPRQMVYAFIGVLLGIIMLVGHLTIKLLILPDNAITPNNEIVSILTAIGLLIIGVCAFALTLVYKTRDIILETEFQNLIFASAARVSTRFCLILNVEKIVIYCDYNFSELFASFDHLSDSFDKLLSHKGLKNADRDRLLRVLSENKPAEVVMKIDDRDYVVVMDAVPRPAGYFIVRGYLKEEAPALSSPGKNSSISSAKPKKPAAKPAAKKRK